MRFFDVLNPEKGMQTIAELKAQQRFNKICVIPYQLIAIIDPIQICIEPFCSDFRNK